MLANRLSPQSANSGLCVTPSGQQRSRNSLPGGVAMQLVVPMTNEEIHPAIEDVSTMPFELRRLTPKRTLPILPD